MNFTVQNQDIFKQIHLYTILIQGTHIIFMNRCQPSLFTKKSTFSYGIKNFNSLPPSVTTLKNDKAQFKAALRKYLHTQSFYSADELFV